MTTSDLSATSFAEPHGTAPASASSFGTGLWSWANSAWPPARRFALMGRPMIPSPMNPTFMLASPFPRGSRRSAASGGRRWSWARRLAGERLRRGARSSSCPVEAAAAALPAGGRELARVAEPPERRPEEIRDAAHGEVQTTVEGVPLAEKGEVRSGRDEALQARAVLPEAGEPRAPAPVERRRVLDRLHEAGEREERGRLEVLAARSRRAQGGQGDLEDGREPGLDLAHDPAHAVAPARGLSVRAARGGGGRHLARDRRGRCADRDLVRTGAVERDEEHAREEQRALVRVRPEPRQHALLGPPRERDLCRERLSARERRRQRVEVRPGERERALHQLERQVGVGSTVEAVDEPRLGGEVELASQARDERSREPLQLRLAFRRFSRSQAEERGRSPGELASAVPPEADALARGLVAAEAGAGRQVERSAVNGSSLGRVDVEIDEAGG